MGRLLLPHDASSSATARRAISADLSSARVCEERIFDAVLVAAELLGNAVAHAQPLDDGAVRITWAVQDGRARIEVHDGGAATRPHLRAAGPSDSDGRGLAIVAALADGWGYDASDGRCVVWAEFDAPIHS